MRRNTRDYQLLQVEMKKLQGSLNDAEAQTTGNSSFGWSELFENPGRKAMTIGIVLASLNQFCGVFAMLQYTSDIFRDAGSSLSPNMSAIGKFIILNQCLIHEII